jgi:hypothetical protein
MSMDSDDNEGPGMDLGLEELMSKMRGASQPSSQIAKPKRGPIDSTDDFDTSLQ